MGLGNKSILMTQEQLKELLLGKEPLRFCREHLFAPDAWVFSEEAGKNLLGSYQDFRHTMADLIDENPNNIAIVGSAKFGHSLKPKTGDPLRAFHDGSDIDIIIVSQRLFHEIVNAYRTAYYNGYKGLMDDHAIDVFRNFVVVYPRQDGAYRSSYLREIWLKFQHMRRNAGTQHRLRNQIKFRVYASWQDAENYHAAGVQLLKKELENAN